MISGLVRSHAIWMLSVLGIVVTGGCTHPPSPFPSPAPTMPTAHFVAYDYGFEGPDQLQAGLTAIGFTNKGPDLHHVQLVKLAEGKTADEFRAALQNHPGELPPWVTFAGGPNVMLPGEQTKAVVRLSPGEYLLICVIPDQQGVPHVAQGMQKPLKVVPPSVATPEPAAGLTIAQVDFGFSAEQPLTPGTHTIRVKNTGRQVHELVVVELRPGATVRDFAAAFEPGAQGPPPGKPIAGITGLEPGEQGFLTVDFRPGTPYGLICFFPDTSGGGAPHFVRGMTLDFTL